MNWEWECEARNDTVAKYHSFTDSSGRVITYAEFVNFLKQKDKDFLKLFIRSLNNATKKFGAYFWECPPLSNETIIKPFEFVATKSEELNNIKQNTSGFEKYLAEIHDINKPNVISFPNLGGDAILVIPAIKLKKVEGGAEMLDYKNLSQFTKNAPFEQQQELWKEVGDKLAESLKNSGAPKWLSTHGLGIHYLHVRIDSQPKYYSCEEYKKENPENSGKEGQKNNSASQSDSGENKNQSTTIKIAKEKILRNLDKICLDPMGDFSNAEMLKNGDAERHYRKGFLDEKWIAKAQRVEIEGEEINLEKIYPGSNDYFEIKRALIQQIKKNPQEWKIVEGEDKVMRNNNWIVQHQSGRRHWKFGISHLRGEDKTEGKRDWDEIEERIKNANSPNTNHSPSQNKQENNGNDRNWTIWIIFTLFMVGSLVLIVYWLGRKKSNKK